uniref:Guided entry of tail-anchored proteins factor 1 n=1 Tax=Biomphalaria glabrata TaxID=6526 RepID=A0A2C9M5J6_BIOGL
MILLVIIFFLEIAFSFLPNLSGFITSLISRLVIKIADEELNIRSEIKDLKEQQSSISATENFAQYARLQRKIDKLVNTVKERDKERRTFIVYLRMKVTAAIYIVHVRAVGLGCWVLVSNAVIHRAKVLVESFL